MQQRTIQQPITFDGIGLHSGKTVTMRLLPADIDTGINFYRTDLENYQSNPIKAHYDIVNDTMMSSNLVNSVGHRIGTVEHLMSAIAGLGIDNLAVEVSAGEIPIMDGSAINFVEKLRQAGIQNQMADKKFIQILRPVEVTDGDKIARFTPYNGFSIDFQIIFDHPAIEQQIAKFDFHQSTFIEQISQARTFGFMKDIEYLKSRNLALGGSMDNAIVFDDKQVLNPEGLRFTNELVRHKILDAIGDLYLAGYQILGAFYGYKSGHQLNNQLLRAIFADENNYKIVTKYDNEMVGICYEDK